jgi:predicted glutamine amidotransferase
MARLFAMIGNRPDLGPRILAAESDALRARSKGSPLGWGIGFYQAGEVLMRRRPIDERPEIDIAAWSADVRADLVVGHVRSATVGALRTENTHPFRYRQWLFAQTGTVTLFDQVRERLLASVPEFLRAGIRGDTDSELLFHVFLSFLHDAGRLNQGVDDPPMVRDALRSTIAVIDGMTAEVGGEPAPLNLVVTNGEFVVAVHRATEDRDMRYRTYSGRGDAELLIGDDLALKRKIPEVAGLHFVLLASDFDEPPSARWKPIAQHAIVTLTRGKEPEIENL